MTTNRSQSKILLFSTTMGTGRMNIRFSIGQPWASVAVALTLVLSGCASVTPKTANYVVPPLGSSWVVARSDSGSFGSTSSQVAVKRGEQMWQGEAVTTLATPGFTQLLKADGKLVAFLSGDKPMASFDPAPGFAYPLEVGKTLTTNHSVTLYPSKKVVPMEVIQKVEAFEDVSVPAGTFKAFRISWIENNGNENTYWINPETGITVKSILTRTAKSPSGPGKRESQLLSQNISK
jgi:hypothetical protein